jgi:hypothetical protein
MKKLFLVLIGLCLVSILAFAQEATKPAATTTATATETTTTTAVTTTTTGTSVTTPEAMVLKGDVIDNMCAGINKDTLAEFVKTHTKECTLKPECVASGYSILTDGKLYKFDQASNIMVEEFLKKADSKLQVSITAKQVGEELSLVSIENQK